MLQSRADNRRECVRLKISIRPRFLGQCSCGLYWGDLPRRFRNYFDGMTCRHLAAEVGGGGVVGTQGEELAGCYPGAGGLLP